MTIRVLIAADQDMVRTGIRGRSNAEIADELDVEASTVKTHVANGLRKLGLRDRTAAIIYAYEPGLVG